MPLSRRISNCLVLSLILQGNAVASHMDSFGWHDLQAPRYPHRQMAGARAKRKIARRKASQRKDTTQDSVSVRPKGSLESLDQESGFLGSCSSTETSLILALE